MKFRLAFILFSSRSGRFNAAAQDTAGNGISGAKEDPNERTSVKITKKSEGRFYR
jgi:hypothetical protein